MITDRQLQVIKTKLIWMTGQPQPNEAYVRWWERQDPFVMEEQAKTFSVKQAYQVISDARQGNWERVIELWTLYVLGGN